MNRLNEEDTIQFANLLCQKLALDLDANDKSSAKIVFQLLLDLPAEVVRKAMKKWIGINRMVQHDIDQDEGYISILEKINQLPEVKGLIARSKVFQLKIDEAATEMKSLGKNTNDLNNIISYLVEKGTWDQIWKEATNNGKEEPSLTFSSIEHRE